MRNGCPAAFAAQSAPVTSGNLGRRSGFINEHQPLRLEVDLGIEPDRYLRRLLVVGATAFMRYAKDKTTPIATWVRELQEKKPFRLVSVALANKLARTAWVVLTRGEIYRPYRPAA